MSLLKELLGIAEAASTEPVDITALADRSPKYLEQYVHALSAQNENRLTYKGKSIFGEIYNKLEEAGQAFLKKEELEISVQIDSSVIEQIGGTDWDSYDYVAAVDDANEVYLGYSPSEDALYIGFDCWLSEDDFNDNWDKAFKDNVGVSYDDEDPLHEKLLSKTWKAYLNQKNNASYLLRYSAGNLSVEMSSEDSMVSKPSQLFYSIIYGSQRFKALKLVDLRLD